MGTELRKRSTDIDGYCWYFTDVDTLDICDADAVESFFEHHHIEACLNCAAYTAVDKAEEEPELAAKVNAEAPHILAQACLRHNALLIHVSTDYVFDGNATTPYREDDEVNPKSVYGTTKAEGERLIRESGCKHCIVRTEWLYSSTGKNFVKTMLYLADTRPEINVVDDQKGAPTWAGDLAQALLLMLAHYGTEPVHETFHFANDGVASWYEFTLAIMELAGKTCKINPITTDQYPAKAKRPANSVFDTTKVKQTLGISIPHWKESLSQCLKELITIK